LFCRAGDGSLPLACPSLRAAKEMQGVPDKEQFFSPNPGQGS